MDYTIFYARLFGIYLILIALAMLIMPQHYKRVALDASQNSVLLLLTGVMSLLIGLVVVLTHNLWHGWAIAVTVLGYAAVLKGLVRLYASAWVAKVAVHVLQNTVYYPVMLLILLWGILLFYCGFFHS